MLKYVIEVVNVSAPKFTKTAGGGYNAIEVAYKRDGKMEGKKLVDFDAKGIPGGKAVYEYFSALKGGETVEVEAVKGEKFWNWVGANAATGSSGTSQEQTQPDTKPADSNSGNESGSRATGPTKGRVTGSNYETSEERAKRQVYIVRQSSLTTALELLKANTTPGTVTVGAGFVTYTPITVETLIATARRLEDYVFEPKKAEGDTQIPF